MLGGQHPWPPSMEGITFIEFGENVNKTQRHPFPPPVTHTHTSLPEFTDEKSADNLALCQTTLVLGFKILRAILKHTEA